MAPMQEPVSVEPVKLTALTSGCSMIACPTWPAPCTMLTTPFGKPAISRIWTSSVPECGASSLGLKTTVLPQTSAGNIFHVGTATGKFQAEMRPHTPIGRRTLMLNLLRSSLGTVWPKRRRPSVAA